MSDGSHGKLLPADSLSPFYHFRSPPIPMRTLLHSLLLTASLTTVVLAVDTPPPAVTPSADTTLSAVEEYRDYTLRSGPLTVMITASGSVESAQVRRIKLTLEQLNGPFVLNEILPNDSFVEAGTVIARFGSNRLARWMRTSQEALEQAKFRAGVAANELSALQRGQTQRLERDEQDLARVQKDWEHYLAHVVEQRTRRENNELQRAENALEVLETEFTQLDKMYRESRIADDTKDIVLERARKSLIIQREGTALTRRDHQQFLDRELPNEKLDWQRSVDRKRQDLEMLRAAQVLAERQKVEELAKAERAVRDAQESLDGYVADQQSLNVTAPFAGILRYTGVEVGDLFSDTANKNVVFAELHRAAPYQVRLPLSPQESQLVHVGDRLRVMVPDLARGDLEGEVISLANMATRNPQGAVHLTATIRLPVDPRLRIGLNARINHRVEIVDALTLPRAFVIAEKGESKCLVRTANGTNERRPVVLGLGNDDHVLVLSGLVAGDVVRRSIKQEVAP
jgi:multidrug resistance efflux pump